MYSERRNDNVPNTFINNNKDDKLLCHFSKYCIHHVHDEFDLFDEHEYFLIELIIESISAIFEDVDFFLVYFESYDVAVNI